MTVTTSTNKVQHLGNGATTAFPYSFRIYSASDLVVTRTVIATGADAILVLNTDYTVTGAGSYNGGNVVMTSAPADGTRITIRRVLAVTQGTDLRNQGAYFAESHEDVFDRLAMIDQQQQETLDRSLKFPTSDAAGAGEIPSASLRANKLMSFDASGNPTAVAPASQSASDVSINLADTADLLKGVALVGGAGRVVNSIAALRALPKTGSKTAFVTDYYGDSFGHGGGPYRLDSNDTTSADNGVTIVVASDDGRWKLVHNGEISLKQAGVRGNGTADDTTRLQAALNCGVLNFFAPEGNYDFTNITIPANVTIEGAGMDKAILQTSTTDNAVMLGGARITLKNLTIKQKSTSKLGKGIVGSDKYWFSTEYVAVKGFDYNLYCDKAIYHSHKQSWFEDGNYGAFYWGISGVWNVDWFNNVITFDTCRFNGNTTMGCYVKGTEVVFINPDWSGMVAAGAIGLRIVGESASYPAHGIKVIAPYAELTQIPMSFLHAYAEIDGGFVQGGASTSRYTSIIDADASTVYWNGRMRDQDFWTNGYRLSNGARLIFEYGFSGSDRSGNTVDATSKVMTADYDEGTFTATLNGCTTAPTVTAHYVRNGKQVTISIPNNSATSNATGCNVTGLPTALHPLRDQIMYGAFFNDGAEVSGPALLQSTGTLHLYPTAFGNAFAAVGTKGHRALTLSYTIK